MNSLRFLGISITENLVERETERERSRESAMQYQYYTIMILKSEIITAVCHKILFANAKELHIVIHQSFCHYKVNTACHQTTVKTENRELFTINLILHGNGKFV